MSATVTINNGSKQKGRAVIRPALRAGMIAMALFGLLLFSQGIWIHAKAILAQVLLDRAFTQSIETGQPVKPWSWADTWPVARIEFPRIGETSIALRGASGQALAFGPGHVDRSAEAGENGTAVYAAHRDTHFAFLKNVQIGDTIKITRRDGKAFTYQVTETSVVHWDQSGIDSNADGKNLVLATCWPFNATTSGPMRYLVKAQIAE
ncbi:class GN sortase [Phyllobacterium sp. OV277]|uniref:class GN sortase n=1 Tax=Phyllobacterium sp. OV277 TaxID=1882772 RepID=UPI00088BC663|nr:class GN sortase [Phyllobacterium sp. OV277]SDP47658.1 sortase A [Phyllobacterium sp. OV277]